MHPGFIAGIIGVIALVLAGVMFVLLMPFVTWNDDETWQWAFSSVGLSAVVIAFIAVGAIGIALRSKVAGVMKALHKGETFKQVSDAAGQLAGRFFGRK